MGKDASSGNMDMYNFGCSLFIQVLTQLFIIILGALNLVTMPFFMAYRTLTQKNLEFSSIFITGGSGGIGAGLAEYYAKSGVHIFLCARKENKLKEVKASCEAKGATVNIFVGDVTNKDLMAEFIKAADKISPIDLVVANAGVAEDESNRFNRLIIDVNITGVINTMEPAVELMKTRNKGHVCLVGSVSSFFNGWQNESNYAATKSWVLCYGRAMRLHLKQFGINVTTVCPGLIATEMSREKLEKRATSFIGKKVAEGAMSTKVCAEHIAYACRRNLQEYLFPARCNVFAAAFRANWRRLAFSS